MNHYKSGIFNDHDTLKYMKAKYESEQHLPEEEDGAEHAAFRNAYLQLLDQQRNWLLALNKKEEIDEEIIRKYQGLIDLEEEKMRIRYEHE